MTVIPNDVLKLIANIVPIDFSGLSKHWNQYAHSENRYTTDCRFKPLRYLTYQHPAMSGWSNVEQRLTFLEWAVFKDHRRLVAYILKDCPWSSGKNSARSITMAIRMNRTECVRMLIAALPRDWFFQRVHSKIFRVIQRYRNTDALVVIADEYIGNSTPFTAKMFVEMLRASWMLIHVIKLPTMEPHLKDIFFVPSLLDYSGPEMYDTYSTMKHFSNERYRLDSAILLYGSKEQGERLLAEIKALGRTTTRLVAVFKSVNGHQTRVIVQKLRSLQMQDTDILDMMVAAQPSYR